MHASGSDKRVAAAPGVCHRDGMRPFFPLTVLPLLLTLLAAPAPAAEPIGLPTDAVRSYEALSTDTPEMEGDMKLSRTSARFTKWAGELRLREAGVRKGASRDEREFVGDVYEVLNPDEYFKLNRGKNGFCDQPIRWMTIRTWGDKGDNAARLRIGLLTVADWKTYNPSGFGGCGGASYELVR